MSVWIYNYFRQSVSAISLLTIQTFMVSVSNSLDAWTYIWTRMPGMYEKACPMQYWNLRNLENYKWNMRPQIWFNNITIIFECRSTNYAYFNNCSVYKAGGWYYNWMNLLHVTYIKWFYILRRSIAILFFSRHNFSVKSI